MGRPRAHRAQRDPGRSPCSAGRGGGPRLCSCATADAADSRAKKGGAKRSATQSDPRMKAVFIGPVGSVGSIVEKARNGPVKISFAKSAKWMVAGLAIMAANIAPAQLTLSPDINLFGDDFPLLQNPRAAAP